MPFTRLFTLLFFLSLVSVASTQVASPELLTCQGTTSSTAWTTYAIESEDVKGIQIQVDTRRCGFDTIPHYVATLESEGGYHWYMTGVNAIYSPTKDGFSVYVRWVDHPTEDESVGKKGYPNPLTIETALDLNLRLHWTAILTRQPTQDEEEGQEEDPSSAEQELTGFDSFSGFDLSPNPVRDLLNISPVEAFDYYEIVTLEGKSLGRYFTESVNISTLAPGVYLLKAHRGVRHAVRRFIKQ